MRSLDPPPEVQLESDVLDALVGLGGQYLKPFE